MTDRGVSTTLMVWRKAKECRGSLPTVIAEMAMVKNDRGNRVYEVRGGVMVVIKPCSRRWPIHAEKHVTEKRKLKPLSSLQLYLKSTRLLSLASPFDSRLGAVVVCLALGCAPDFL